MRLFIGMPIPKSPKLTQVTHALRGAHDGVKSVPPGTWHVTMRFLGEVKDPAPAEAAMHEAARGHHAMACRVEGISAFQSTKRARVIWTKVKADGLQELAADVTRTTAGIGEPIKTDFVAHATLARLHRPVDATAFCTFHQGLLAEGVLDRLVLYRSVLGPQGAVHERLAEVILPEA